MTTAGPAYASPAAGASDDTSVDAAALYAKVTRRLLPMLFLCYVACYLDRVNVGFAKLQMASALGFSDTVYGFGAGVFFIGYFLFEMPSNMILYRVGARLWLARIMITWGLVSAATLFVKSPTMFYAMRFLLGVAEAGFFPGVVLYLTQWFPSARRGKVMAFFMTGMPLAGVAGGPLSGWIMQHMGNPDGAATGLASWQWLFLIEALPSIILGVVLIAKLPNRVTDARWLTSAEQQRISADVEAERRETESASLAGVLSDWRVWVSAAINFSFVMGLYGIGFWLPTIVKRMGVQSNFEVGCLTAIPYAAAAILMIIVGRSADKHRERRWHVILPALAGSFGFLLSTVLVDNHTLVMIALTIATAGIITTLPLFWGLPTGFLRDGSGAAAIAMINAVGALAGFVSPYLVGWLNDLTHDPRIGIYVLAVSAIVGSLLVLTLPAKLVNR